MSISLRLQSQHSSWLRAARLTRHRHRHLDNPKFFRQSQQHASTANRLTHISTRTHQIAGKSMPGPYKSSLHTMLWRDHSTAHAGITAASIVPMPMESIGASVVRPFYSPCWNHCRLHRKAMSVVFARWRSAHTERQCLLSSLDGDGLTPTGLSWPPSQMCGRVMYLAWPGLAWPGRYHRHGVSVGGVDSEVLAEPEPSFVGDERELEREPFPGPWRQPELSWESLRRMIL
jgi:hypothetical protein